MEWERLSVRAWVMNLMMWLGGEWAAPVAAVGFVCPIVSWCRPLEEGW